MLRACVAALLLVGCGSGFEAGGQVAVDDGGGALESGGDAEAGAYVPCVTSVLPGTNEPLACCGPNICAASADGGLASASVDGGIAVVAECLPGLACHSLPSPSKLFGCYPVGCATW